MEVGRVWSEQVRSEACADLVHVAAAGCVDCNWRGSLGQGDGEMGFVSAPGTIGAANEIGGQLGPKAGETRLVATPHSLGCGD